MIPGRRRSARVPALLALLPLLSCAPPVPVPLTPSPPGEDPPAGEPDTGHGWSVRLRTEDEPAAAHEAASEAAPRFDEPVTVVQAGGAWHVHVGTLATKERARALTMLARERGYRSATVVSVPPPDPAPEERAAPAPRESGL
ncbi:hypothetical protein K8I85_02760 [bacterium]|nr:hypothetical protein [bacterium]